jgi:hypothetical protein
VVRFIKTVWIILEQCTIRNFINDDWTEYLGGGKKIVVMAKMGELMKSDQIRGRGLCFRSGGPRFKSQVQNQTHDLVNKS